MSIRRLLQKRFGNPDSLRAAIDKDPQTAVSRDSEIATVENLIQTIGDPEFRERARDSLFWYSRKFPGVSDAVGASYDRQLAFKNTTERDAAQIFSKLNTLRILENGLSQNFRLRESADFVLHQINRVKLQSVRYDIVKLSHLLLLEPARIEGELLSLLKRKPPYYISGTAIAALGAVGSKKSVPILRHHAEKSRTYGEIVNALYALERICGGEQVQDLFFFTLQKRSNTQLKQVGLRLMLKHGDARAVPIVKDRIRKILSGPTYSGRFVPSPMTRPELVDAFAYLRKHSLQAELEMLKWVIWSRRRDYLDEAERDYVIQRAKELNLSNEP